MASVDTDTDTQMDYLSATDGFTDVLSNKKRKRIMSRNDATRTTSGSTSAAVDVREKKVKAKTVIGSNSTCSLKAAKELYNKRIFCVSNVSDKTDLSELKNYIETFDIAVLSIFDAKTKFKDSKSFRVCIKESDITKFVANDIWASHIIVREWVFKGNNKS